MGTRAEERNSIGNITMTTDSVNITGHTSQIQAISHLGSDPDQWLLALRGLEELENGPRKRKLLKHFFAQSGKILDSALLRKSRSYAVLLGKEALFYGEIDVDDARHAFQMGLSMCQNTSVLYVMFAQFELDQGRKDKALKVLKHGQVCVEYPSEIIAAKAKLEQGFTRIDGSKEKQGSLPLKNITNEVKADVTSIRDRKTETILNQIKVPITESRKSNNPNADEPCRITNPPSHPKESRSRFSFPTVAKKSPAEWHPSHLQPVPEIPQQVSAKKIVTKNYDPCTPPPHRITELKSHELGLMDSPVSPNVTFELTTQPKTVAKPGGCSDPSTYTQQGITKSMNSFNLQDTLSKSNLAPSSFTSSERKSSPFSRLMQQRCQTTGKKPARVPTSNAPRRVLMKGPKSRLSDSDSEDDIRPIQKSPDDVNGPVLPENKEKNVPNPPVQEQYSVAKPSAINNKEVSSSFSASLTVENSLPQVTEPPLQHASKPDQERQSIQPSRNYMEHPPSLEPPPDKSQQERPQVQVSVAAHSTLSNKENSAPWHLSTSSGVHQSDVASGQKITPHSVQVPNNHHIPPRGLSDIRCQNPSDSGSSNSAVHVRYSAQSDFHNMTQQRDVHSGIHLAHRLIMEKKIIEVNGTPYILLKLLGKGGSSKVYQVLDPKSSTIAAVKQVNLVGCESSVLEGYINEINFLKKLQGNHYIIKLIDYEIRERHLYLVMECGSLDLSAFLKNQKLLGENLEMIDILAFWKNMLRAVEAIHKHGVIHLDLKPANFMLIDYTLKLIDFGIANSIQVDATSIIKDTQFGTLNYMAPETINDLSDVQTGPTYEPKFKVGPKADVWSLGCILYYIMYGKTPFQHIHHQMKKLLAITNEKHRIDFPDFPRRELIEIVQACLIRDPKKRPSVQMLLNHPLLK